MKNFMTLLALLSLAACSDGGGGGFGGNQIPGTGLPALTDGQMQTTQGFSQEKADVSHATKAYTETPASATPSLGIQSQSREVSAFRVSEKGQTYENEIGQAVDANCVTEQEGFESPEGSDPSSIPDKFEIEGRIQVKDNGSGACPVTSILSHKMVQTQNPLAMNMTTKVGFEVKDWLSVAEEMDITKFSMETKMAFNVQEQGNGGSMAMNMSIAGDFQSKSLGNVRNVVSMTLNASGASENDFAMNSMFVNDIQFPEFRAVGVIVVNMTAQNQEDPNVTYYINGVVVEQEEFAELFDSSDMAQAPVQIPNTGL